VRDALDAPFRYVHSNHLIVQEIHRTGLSFWFKYDRYDDPSNNTFANEVIRWRGE